VSEPLVALGGRGIGRFGVEEEVFSSGMTSSGLGGVRGEICIYPGVAYALIVYFVFFDG